MKKLVFLLFLSTISISSLADNFNCDFTSFSDFRSIGDFSFYSDYRYSRISKNQIFVELGPGLSRDSECYVDLGFGWRHHFNRYLSWDLLTTKVLTNCSHFFQDETTFIELLTGVRGTTPVIFSGKTLYLSAKGGCLIPFEGDVSFAFELGAGINLSNNFSVGYAFTYVGVDGQDCLHSLQLCFAF